MPGEPAPTDSFLNTLESSRDAILLTRMPIPPSSNNQYTLYRRGAKTFHVPSQELQLYRKKVKEWSFQYLPLVNASRAIAQQWKSRGYCLEVNAVFSFEKSRIVTLKGSPKKMDVSNRIKALHDELSRILDIDDCWFFRVIAQKRIRSENEMEMVSVEIVPIRE